MTAEHAHGIDTGGEVEALARGWWEGAPNEGDWLRRDRNGREWSDAAREAYTDATRTLLSSQAFTEWLAARKTATRATAADTVLATARRLCCGDNPAPEHSARADHSQRMAFAEELARAVRGS